MTKQIKILVLALVLFFFAHPTYAAWHTAVLDSEGWEGSHSSIAVDSHGKVHISYYDETNGDLKHATNASGNWTFETVDSEGNVGLFTSIAIDGQDKIHISYNDNTNKTLKYATNASGSWTTRTVDTGFYYWGGRTSLTLDSSDKAHIGYLYRLDSSNVAIKHATNASGSWTTEAVSAEYGSDVSLAVDEAGNAHASWGKIENSKLYLRYASNESGAWVAQTIDSAAYSTTGDCGYTSLKLDAAGKVHISYYFYTFNTTSTRVLRYATNASGQWTKMSVDYGGEYSSLAIDAADKIHIAYTGWDPVLKYATNETGSWTKETIDGGGGDYSSLAVEPSGKIHVSYYDDMADDLKYARNFFDYALTVNKTGKGLITSSPSGIDCGPVCTSGYDPGTEVTLTALPESGSSFAGWTGGGCSGTGACTVTMNDHVAVTAAFSPADISLEALDFSPKSGIVVGAPMEISATIRNNQEAIATPFTVGFYINDSLVASVAVTGMEANAEKVVTGIWNVRPGTNPVVKVIADHTNALVESDEGNNVRQMEIPLSLIAPDISVESLDFLPKSGIVVGTQLQLSAVVKNNSDPFLTPFFVGFYINGALVSSVEVPGMEANGQQAVTGYWNVTPGTNPALRVLADHTNVFAETNEENNVQQMEIPLSLTAPDVSVESLDYTPKSGIALGTPIQLSAVVKNNGDRFFTPFTVGFYVNDVLVSSAKAPGMEANAEQTVTADWLAAPGANPLLKIVADDENLFAEADEENNVQQMEIPLSLTAPDISLESLDYLPKSGIMVGTGLQFSALVKNRGDRFLTPIEVGFYVNGVRVSSAPIPGMEAGAEQAVTGYWQAAAGIDPVLKVAADDGNVFSEADEANNSREMPIAMDVGLPDVSVEQLAYSPQDNIAAGTRLQLLTTLRNNGLKFSKSFRVAFFVNGALVSSVRLSGMEGNTEQIVSGVWTVAPGADPLLRVFADSAGELPESNEDNNIQEMQVPLDVKAPDFAVEKITFLPDLFSDGDAVQVVADIRNIGEGAFSGPLPVSLFVDGVFKLTKNLILPELNSPASLSFDWLVRAGSQSVTVTLDSENRIAESDKTNNTLSKPLPVMGSPDLQVREISLNPSTELKDGDPVTVTARIVNAGSGAAKGLFYVQFASGGRTIRDVQIDTGLDAGAMITIEQPWIFTAGAAEISVTADSHDQVGEADETNNVATIGLPLAALPDLAVSTLTWTPQERSDGDTITLRALVANEGGGTTRDMDVRFTVDGKIAGIAKLAGGLAASQSAEALVNWNHSAADRTLNAVVDPQNLISESNEQNNGLTVSLPEVALPDLVVTDIFYSPETYNIGDIVTLSATIVNQGAGATTRDFTVGFTFEGKSIGGVPVIHDFGPQESYTVKHSWKVGYGSTLQVTADSDHTVYEGDAGESNNTKILQLPELPYPDITVKSVSWNPPAAISAGQAVTFSAVLENTGTSVSEPVTVQFLVDDEQKERRTINGGLWNGLSVTMDFTWIAASGPSHTVTVSANPDGAIAELNRDNNQKTMVIDMPIGKPDFSVIDLTVTPQTGLHTGDQATLSVTVKNEGPGDYLQPLLVGFFIGGKKVEMVGDVQTPGGLLADQTASLSLPVAVGPFSNLPLTAVADVNNSVAEGDEGNNTRTILFPAVPKPDLTILSVTPAYQPPLREYDPVQLDITVKNSSAEPVEGAITLEGTIGFSPLHGVIAGGLQGGEEKTVQITWLAVPGENPPLTLIVDPQNGISETDETNNRYEALLPVAVAKVEDFGIALSPQRQTGVIGASLACEILLDNRLSTSSIFDVTVKGLEGLSYRLETPRFFAAAGENRTILLNIAVPDDFNPQTTQVAFTVGATSADTFVTKSADGILDIEALPLPQNLKPEADAKLGSTHVHVTWTSLVDATSKVYLRKEGGAAYREFTGKAGRFHDVPLSGLERNALYSYYIESTAPGGTYTGTERQFRIDNGISFSQEAYSFNVEKDYDQRVTVNVVNTDSAPHILTMEMDNPYPDLILNFVGPGSADNPIPLNPGESQAVVLALHLQDVTNDSYELPARIASRRGEEILADAAPLAVKVHIPVIDYGIEQISENPVTLAKSFRVTNRGDVITDFNISIEELDMGYPVTDALKEAVVIYPAIAHYRLDKNETLEFQAIPLLGHPYFQAIFGPPAQASDLSARVPLASLQSRKVPIGIKGVFKGLGRPAAISEERYLQSLRMATAFPTESTATQQGAASLRTAFESSGNGYAYSGSAENLGSESETSGRYCTNRPTITTDIDVPNYEREEISADPLYVTFTPSGRETPVLPHDTHIYLNHHLIASYLDQVPSGTKRIDFDPSLLILPKVGIAKNKITIHTSHMNGGHYVVTSDFKLRMDVDRYTQYVMAASPEEAQALVGGNLPAYMFSGPESISLGQLETGGAVIPGKPVTIRIPITKDNGEPGKDLAVSALVDGEEIILVDKTHDGVYEGTWVPKEGEAAPSGMASPLGMRAPLADSRNVTVRAKGPGNAQEQNFAIGEYVEEGTLFVDILKPHDNFMVLKNGIQTIKATLTKRVGGEPVRISNPEAIRAFIYVDGTKKRDEKMIPVPGEAGVFFFNWSVGDLKVAGGGKVKIDVWARHETLNDTAAVSGVYEEEAASIDFTADKFGGPGPLEVAFEDRSKGEIDSWYWEFGDGSVSTEQDPSHTFAEDGSYTVKLTITKSDGTKLVKAKEGYITVSPYGLELRIYADDHYGVIKQIFYQGGTNPPAYVRLHGTVKSLTAPDIPLSQAEVWIEGALDSEGNVISAVTDAGGGFEIEVDAGGTDPAKIQDVNLGNILLPPMLKIRSNACDDVPADRSDLEKVDYLTMVQDVWIDGAYVPFIFDRDVPRTAAIHGTVTHADIGVVPYREVLLVGEGVDLKSAPQANGTYSFVLPLNGPGPDGTVSKDVTIRCNPLEVHAFPKASILPERTAIVPLHRDLPALIRVNFSPAMQPKPDEEVFFQFPDDMETGTFSQTRQSNGDSLKSLTVTTDAEGWAQVYYFPSLPALSGGQVSLPYGAVIRATHVASGGSVTAEVKVGLGLELVSVDTAPDFEYDYTRTTPYGLLVRIQSSYFPDLNLADYSDNAKNDVWKDRTLGVHLRTEWLNRDKRAAGIPDDEVYDRAAAFVYKTVHNKQATFLRAMGPPSYSSGSPLTDYPALVLKSPGMHIYSVHITGAVLTDESGSIAESLTERAIRGGMIVLLTVEEETSAIDDLICSLNATSSTQMAMLKIAKMLDPTAYVVGELMDVASFICDIRQGNYGNAALTFMNNYSGKILDKLRADEVYQTLSKREQWGVVFGQEFKDVCGELKDETDIFKKWYEEQQKSPQRVPLAYANASYPSSEGYFNVLDFYSLLYQRLMMSGEIFDHQLVMMIGLNSLSVKRPDGTEVPLLNPDTFDSLDPLPEYVYVTYGDFTGAAVAFLPKGTNYTFTFTPSPVGFRMNLADGETENHFMKFDRMEQATKVVWESGSSVLKIDATGDDVPDLDFSPQVVDFEDIKVLADPSVTGRILSSNIGISGVPVSLSGEGASRIATTDGDGRYRFTEVAPGAYTLTPSKTNYTFDPGSWSISVSDSDIQNQDFVARYHPPLHSLFVTKSGSGTVTGTPAGINCGEDCAADYEEGAAVILTASPAAGWDFTGWGGGCSGADGCQLLMDRSRDVTAAFGPDTTPPANPALVINSGATATTSAVVTVTLSGTDSGGVTGYYLSENAEPPGLGAFTPVSRVKDYRADLPFTVSGGEGSKTIYGWLRDGAGNISASASDTIVYSTPRGPTEVCGEVHDLLGGPWTLAGTPYIVTCNITVPEGRTLTVDPGVEVKFDGDYGIDVFGTLRAKGTAAAPIVFTSNAATQNRGDWKSIRFQSTGGESVMDHCIVEYGGGDTGWGWANISIDGISTVTVSNSRIRQSDDVGIHVVGEADPVITQNEFSFNSYDAMAVPLNSFPVLAGNLAHDNDRWNGIVLSGGNITRSGTWYGDTMAYVIDDYGSSSGNRDIVAGAVLTIEPGAVVKMENNGTLTIAVHGSLRARGTAEAPIVFTSLADDDHLGDTNGDGPSTGSPSDWESVGIDADSTGNILVHCIFRYGGQDEETLAIYADSLELRDVVVSHSGSDGIRVEGASPALLRVTSEDNGFDGIYCVDASPAITGGVIRHNDGNGIGLVRSSPGIEGCTLSGNARGINVESGSLPTLAGNDTSGNGDYGVYYEVSGERYDGNGGPWTLAGSPYVVVGDLAVPEGETLTVEPGVEVRFEGNFGLDVFGTLKAVGTEASPITFTSNRETPNRGDWKSIYFESTGGDSVLDHCIVEYGGSDTGWGWANIAIDGISTVTVANTVSRHSYDVGIQVMGGSDPAIAHNEFSFNLNDAMAVEVNSYPALSGNSAHDNDRWNGVMVYGGHITRSGAWHAGGLPYVVNDSGSSGGNRDIVSGVTLTIDPGTVIKMEDNGTVSFAVHGTLHASGTAGAPIVFTSLADDDYLGDTNGDGSSTGLSAHWESLSFEADSTDNRLNHCVFKYGGQDENTVAIFTDAIAFQDVTVSSSGGDGIKIENASPALLRVNVENSLYDGIYCVNASPSLFNVRATNNGTSGVGLNNSSPTIQYCFLTGNGDAGLGARLGSNPVISNSEITGNFAYGVSNEDTGVCLDARGNWWGDISGPLDPVDDSGQNCGFYNPEGKGGTVGSGVRYDGWLVGPPVDMVTDTDGDGVPDSQDAFPNDPEYHEDSDRDGIADQWEIKYFGRLTRAGTTSDYDSDGVSDLNEFLNGTDPRAGIRGANGDINRNRYTDLADAILAMKIFVRLHEPQLTVTTADVNKDGRIGVEEVIFILQRLAELR